MDNITALLQQNQGIITSIYKSNNYIYVILLMSPFFIQYCVCIIVNQHLSKWCNSLNTNSHKKISKSPTKTLVKKLHLVPKCFYELSHGAEHCLRNIPPKFDWHLYWTHHVMMFFFLFICLCVRWRHLDQWSRFWYCKIVTFVKARLRVLTSQASKYHQISIKQSLNNRKGVF